MKPFARPDGVGRDDHPLDEQERIALHEHPVRERARVALVRVAADELQLAGRIQHGLPLDPGREAGATATAQAGGGDLGHDVLRGHGQGLLERDQTAVRAVVRDRQGIDDADAREHPPLLAGQVRDLIRRAMAERMVAAGQQARVEQARDVARRDRPVGDAAGRRLDLDERLQPEQAAGPIADDGDVERSVACVDGE